ncbi:MAG TPA: histidine phosphatase family protein [Opitutaceae bacterium]
MASKIFLIRHGETEWALAGRHTGWTDVPLTTNGERCAAKLQPFLAQVKFSRVFVSPLQRAQRTAELAGHRENAIVDEDLHEWDYGDYEGKTSVEIKKQHPGWNVWEFGAPGGESLTDVTTRADRVLARVKAIEGTVALFGHGQFLRAVAMRCTQREVTEGRRFAFDAACVSVLGFEHAEDGVPGILLWNADAGGALPRGVLKG